MQPRLVRNKRTFEFFVRYPHGSSAISGHRRAARHFKLHTMEDPSFEGSDAYRVLVHKSAAKLREVTAVLKKAGESDDESLVEDAEIWLMCDSGVNWFSQDWSYWAQGDDENTLEALGWHRSIVESGQRYRVTIRAGKRS